MNPVLTITAQVDPVESAKSAGLRYTRGDAPGIQRIRRGDGFRYVDAAGRPVRDRETLQRINALRIPPAWEKVWICARPDGHLQATGRDVKNRKQYVYHPRFREVRDGAKYSRMFAFGRALPVVRARVAKDLARPDLPREKVLAAVVRLLEATLIRVGNEEYARTNRSFGLTTMRVRHVEIEGAALRFRFRGKSGVKHDADVNDARLARVVSRCQELPGEELFQFLDETGEPRTVDSADVNEYLRDISGEEFTAKDFRTWAGTVLAAHALQEFESFDSQTQAKRNVMAAIEGVAKRLGNTKAVCRKCYVHPAILDAYLDGSLVKELTRRVERELADSLADLRPEEVAVLAFLHARLKRDAVSSK